MFRLFHVIYVCGLGEMCPCPLVRRQRGKSVAVTIRAPLLGVAPKVLVWDANAGAKKPGVERERDIEIRMYVLVQGSV